MAVRSVALSAQTPPFSLDYLAKHLHLNKGDVVSAGFIDSKEKKFAVHFKEGKEAEAEKFFQILKDKNCFPFFELNRLVTLDSRMKSRIITTALTWQPPQSPPFSLDYLAEHFHLNKEDVAKACFDDLGIMFEIHFKEGKEAEAKKFSETLSKRGCFPQYIEFNRSVCLNFFAKDKIIAAAQGGVAFSSASHSTFGSMELSSFIDPSEAIYRLPDHENFQTLTPTLQTGITWVQKFVRIIPDVRVVKRFNEEGEEADRLGGRGSYAIHNSRGEFYRLNYHRFYNFIESMKADFPVLNNLTADEVEEIKLYCEKHQKQIYSTKLFAAFKYLLENGCSETSLGNAVARLQ